MVPSLFSRRILPSRLFSDWAFDGDGVLADGDIELAVRPEREGAAVVIGGAVRFSRSSRTTSLPAAATSPLAVNRLTRLWIVGLVAV